MSSEYRNNHYVPVWYQKRFIPLERRDIDLLYLDLSPGTFKDPRGVAHYRKSLHQRGPKYCFFEKDLYTANFSTTISTEIERHFFGDIDSRGIRAVEHFGNFNYTIGKNGKILTDLMMFMTTQKLRTPKGLGWLKEKNQMIDKNSLLREMINLREMFCAIWTESVWQIADASKSETKFIISDHPITVYNKEYGPRHQKCKGYNDPDIWQHGTHTIFPLSLNKILILTNLSWVRNPYQSSKKNRPNPYLFRDAIFFTPSVQTERFLSEQEVREINFIIKSRALRYVAGGSEDWLYPERHVTKSDWNQYGNGYLLMPDPRAVQFSTETLLGFKNGSSTGYDPYGRRPWQKDYKQTSDTHVWNKFLKFRGEFARLFGPDHRGRTLEFGYLGTEKDTEEFHNSNLRQEKQRGN